MAHTDEPAADGLHVTPREAECLRLVGQHLQTKEIARALNLTPNTVNSYIKSACDRLGVASRREAAQRLAALETPAIEAPSSDIDPQEATSDRLWAWLTERLESPGPKTRMAINVSVWVSFGLAGIMTAQSLVFMLNSALQHQAAELWPRDALFHRRVWPDIFFTGAPAGRLLFALCFFVPGLALLKGGAAYRLGAWSTLAVVVSTMCLPFGPTALTAIDALQLAVYLSLLKLSRQLWVQVIVTIQLCTLAADISFYIEGIIDGSTWDMVQIVSVLIMTLSVWASLVIPRDRLSPDGSSSKSKRTSLEDAPEDQLRARGIG